MLDALIREVSARWGLADQGRPLIQMLLAHINNPATGGMTGFLDRFRQAGWGGMVNTWVANNTAPEVPTTSQIETVLGSGEGLLNQMANRLGLTRDKVSAAVAGILPMLISRMTPDGTIPARLPAEFDSLARDGQALLGLGAATHGASHTAAYSTAASPAAATPARSGIGKWLPWLIAALVVIFGVSYCGKNQKTAEPVAPAATTEPAVSSLEPSAAPPANEAVAVSPPSETPASSLDTAPTDTTAATPASDVNPASSNFTVPDGADVVDDMANGMPVLRVFFDTGKTDVAASFVGKSTALVQFLAANTDVTAVVSGFNDPTGDAARNAELSKQRAQAVKAALEAAGVAPERVVLEKPAETTDTGTTNAASRRVDVMLRR